MRTETLEQSAVGRAAAEQRELECRLAEVDRPESGRLPRNGREDKARRAGRCQEDESCD